MLGCVCVFVARALRKNAWRGHALCLPSSRALWSVFVCVCMRCLTQVEIIGDAYFVVGGCPTECDDHAERIAAFGMKMLQVRAPVSLSWAVCYLLQ